MARVCVCLGSMCRRGHVWQGACMAGGHAWQGGVHGRGHTWPRACVAGGACVAREMATTAGSRHPTGMHYCVEHVSTESDSDLDPFSQMGTVPILGMDL